MRILAAGIAVILFLHSPARAAMNPINNPATNIYNPASRMDNPDPLSPPTQPVPELQTTEVTPVAPPMPAAQQIKAQPQPLNKPGIPQKRYSHKTAGEYLSAAKKSFARKDYGELLFITEDALRRISAGTLKASRKTKQQLVNYKKIGYEFQTRKTMQEIQEP